MLMQATQCRAARGLLNWSQGELGQKARVDRKTIADYERGFRSPHPRTLEALLKALEAAGIEFLDPIEGVCGSGVRFRWGAEPLQRTAGGSEGEAGGANQDASQASAWDDGIDALHEEAPPAVDPEIEELRAYWRANPAKWAAMHKSTRWALLDEMGLRQL